jgi:calcineurin-like phosphoesterase family protein
MKQIWFCSDTHFSHANIIKYCNRPFADTDEMDEALIRNWNSVVKPGDDVFHLGDVSFAKDQSKTCRILDRLNGNKFLIKGNHDKITDANLRAKFSFIRDYYELYVTDESAHGGKQLIVLLHFAMKIWNKCHRGSIHLYGHSHGTLPDDPGSLSMDVGVDSHNYTPISYEQVKAFMAKKTFKPVDHHKETLKNDTTLPDTNA